MRRAAPSGSALRARRPGRLRCPPGDCVRPSSLIGEPGARSVSPFLFLLVILTFFLVFAGVSCNSAATKSAIGSIDASQGVSSAQAAQVNACIDALNGVNILTYNGWQLAFGKDPVIGSVPAACNQNNAAATNTSSANIGPQLLAFLALLCVGLALLFAIAGAFGLVVARSRAFVCAIFGAGAAALLILDHLHVHDLLLAKIASSEGSTIPGLDPASLFSINPGIGLIVALVILALAVLYNIRALMLTSPPVADVGADADADAVPAPTPEASPP